MIKNTPTQKYIDKAAKQAAEAAQSATMTNCNFVVTAEFSESMEVLAEAALENAKAIHAMARVLKASNVNAVVIGGKSDA